MMTMTNGRLATLKRDAECGMDFGYHLTMTYGRWCIAPRLSSRLKESGYAVAFTQKRYQELRHQWERERYGATLDGIEAAGPYLLAALLGLMAAQADGLAPPDDDPRMVAAREAIAIAEA